MKLDPRVLGLLEKEGIHTARDLLSADTYQLIGKTGLGYNELKELRLHVSSRIVPQPVTASAMLQAQLASQVTPSTVIRGEPSQRISYHLPTGITSLDNLLHGGIVVGGITEVVGAPGIGKTQLCLNCCAQVLLFPCITEVTRGSEGISANVRSVIYIDTELKFSPDRLADILVHRILEEEKGGYSNPTMNTKFKTRRDELYDIVKSTVLNRVKVIRPISSAEMMAAVQSLESIVIEDRVALIVIDSIAAIARKEGVDEADKEIVLVRLAAELIALADLCCCAVLITNQIAPVSAHSAVHLHHQMPVEFGQYQPALGMIWSHILHTRLCMFISPEQQIDDVSDSDVIYDLNSGPIQGRIKDTVRLIEVTKCPVSLSDRVPCCIGLLGLMNVVATINTSTTGARSTYHEIPYHP